MNSPDQLKGITDVVDVTGHVGLSFEKLTSLPVKFGKVSGNFYCDNNQLTSLERCPTEVGGSFSCDDNNLTSLEGCPTEVGGSFYCGDNKLVSFKGCPSEIHGNFWCENNQLTSLVGIHKIIKKIDGVFDITINSIQEGGIGLLLIDGLEKIDADHPALKIINKYLGQGKMDLLACQEELIENGYEDFAKL